MRKTFSTVQIKSVDIAIIGGGIQGAAIAHQGAARGLSVALFEKGDFASGTSSRTSHLIHGGIRYLEQGAFGLVREALHERHDLLRLAPHLVRPMPFLYPIYQGGERGRLKLQLGLMLYALLAGSKQVGNTRMLSRSEVIEREPAIESDHLQGAAFFYDCTMDDARLCLSTILSAEAAGAAVFNYTEVTGLLKKEGTVCGVAVEEKLTGHRGNVSARLVINAAGPWADQVCRMEGEAPSRIRGTKGIHIMVPKLTQAAVVIPEEGSQRIFFVIPWNEISLIGTTDTDFDGEIDAPMADPGEVKGLLAKINRFFPSARLSDSDVIAEFAGIRPLVYHPDASPSDLSREGTIEWTSGGMLALIGGKYTVHRATARKALGKIAKRHPDFSVALRSEKRCSLHGGEIGDLDRYLRTEMEGGSNFCPVGIAGTRHLIHQYGSEYKNVLRLIKTDHNLAAPLTPLGYPFAAEVVYAVQVEHAVRLSDFMRRRTPLALGRYRADRPMIQAICLLMSRELGWSQEHVEQEIENYFMEIGKTK